MAKFQDNCYILGNLLPGSQRLKRCIMLDKSLSQREKQTIRTPDVHGITERRGYVYVASRGG